MFELFNNQCSMEQGAQKNELRKWPFRKVHVRGHNGDAKFNWDGEGFEME